MKDLIVSTVLKCFPETQAVYLFGSRADNSMREHSDVDLAVLLPVDHAQYAGELIQSDLRFLLEKRLKKDVDLINLRLVSTVFQNEICHKGIRLYCGNPYETEIFEMMSLSLYCKLNEERKEILESIADSRRIHNI